jgi:hypothetical protein
MSSSLHVTFGRGSGSMIVAFDWHRIKQDLPPLLHSM